MTPARTRTNPAANLAALIFLGILLARIHTDAMPYQRTLRLCSRSLSDALFLVCKDRGFNEPFSYSGEETDDEDPRPASTAGPRRGLVQECCHRSCSIEHLERYCKPLPQPSRREDAASRGNAIAGSVDPEDGYYRIVNLPFTSVKELQVVKKPRSHKRRKKGNRKKCRCQKRGRRQHRFRTSDWRKVSRETVIPKVPAFQVGTTSPEPIDSIIIFPFKSELSLGRIDGAVGADPKDEGPRRSR